jgi:hypothetical protein
METSREHKVARGIQNLCVSDVQLEAFSKSQDPMVVMTMPGCYEIAGNQSHAARFRKIKTGSIVDRYELLESLRSTDSSSALEKLCYCTKRDAPVALESADCAYEAAYENLLRTPIGSWASSLGFFYAYPDNANGRVFEAASIRTRLLDSYQTLLLCRELRLPTLEVVVTELESLDSDSVKFNVQVRFEKNRFSSSNEVVFSLKDTPYGKLRMALSKALAQLNDENIPLAEIRDALLQEAQGLSDNYQPVQSLIREIFCRMTSEDEPPRSKIERRVKDLWICAFDAPAIRTVRPQVEKQIDIENAIIRAGFSSSALEEMDKEETSWRANDIQGTSLELYPRANANWRAFKKLRPELQVKYPGQVVAICDGDVIAFGKDAHKVAEEAWSRAGDKHVLVQAVDERKTPIHIPTPRIG